MAMAKPAPRDQGSTTSAHPRALLVEDNYLSASMLAVVLEDRGYHVQTVGSVREALEALKRHDFTHMIVDLMLPDGAGEDVVRAARQGGSEAKVIVVTGVNDPERLRKVVELGPQVMMKPISGEHLLRAMGDEKAGTA
jgi:DNA-binding response OmpR family regulator